MQPAPPVLLLLLAAPVQSSANPRENLNAGLYLKVLGESEAALKRNPADAMAWASKSQALTALLRFKEGEDAASSALQLKPDLADAYLARGLVRAAKAVQQRNLGSIRKASSALDDLRRATELDPGLVAAWNSLGLAYQQLPGLLGGSTREALRCAEQLMRVSPARGSLLKGMIHTLDGRWRKAEPWLLRAVELAPQDPQVVYGYLEALGHAETRDSFGQEAWQRRLGLDARRLLPGIQRSARGVQAVCDALLDAGEGEEAWRLASISLPTSDSPSLLRLQLGKIAARSGLHRNEGLSNLDSAAQEPLEGGSGGLPSLHWRRGQILKDLGRVEEARAAGGEALRLDPHHPGARRLLRDLNRSSSLP